MARIEAPGLAQPGRHEGRRDHDCTSRGGVRPGPGGRWRRPSRSRPANADVADGDAKAAGRRRSRSATRIEERAGKAAAGRRAPTTSRSRTRPSAYDMVPDSGRRVRDGIGRPDGPKADEQPPHKVTLDAFWMQTHEVTWDEYLMFMFADQAQRAATSRTRWSTRVSRPTAPHLEMSFGMGNQRLSGDQHDAARREQVRRVAERADRASSTACRPKPNGSTPAAPAGAGRAPRRSSATTPGSEELANSDFTTARTTRSARRSRTRGASTTCSATSWSGRSISTRRTRPAPAVNPWVESTHAVSARGARRLVERRRGPRGVHGARRVGRRRGSSRIRNCRRASGT